MRKVILVIGFIAGISSIILANALKIGIWTVEIENDSISGQTVTASTTATSGNNLGQTLSSDGKELIIRCDIDGAAIYYHIDTFFSSSYSELPVIWKIDSNKPVKENWGMASSYRAIFMPDESLKSFYKQALKGKLLKIRVNVAPGIPGSDNDYTFKLTGLTKAAKYLKCFK